MSEQQTEPGTNPRIRFVRLPEVVGWIEAELDDWLRSRIAESRGGDEIGSGRELATQAER